MQRKQWEVSWFNIISKQGWRTKNIRFEPHMVGGSRATDNFDIRSFRLRIEDADLTKFGQASKASNPKFTGDFTENVLAFARREKLDLHESEDEMDATRSDSDHHHRFHRRLRSRTRISRHACYNTATKPLGPTAYAVGPGGFVAFR